MNEASPDRRRVFIVDDHPVFAQGLAHLIEVDGRLSLSGTATNVATALEALARTEVDVLVVDLSLDGGSGLDLLKAVSRDFPGLRAVVISMHDEALYGERALRAGAAGFVMKHESGARMLDAICAVAAGEIWVSDTLAKKLVLKVARGRTGSPLEVLSDRELEVFELIGKGRSSDEIGRALHISKKTVESHRLNIRAKLLLESGLELVRYAIQWTQLRAE